MPVPCETASWTIYLYFIPYLLMHRVAVSIFTFFFPRDHTYLYKVIASIIWHILGETDAISGCDYSCLKSIPIKNPAEISTIIIIHHKRHKQKACSSPDNSSNHSQGTHIIRKMNKWTIYPIWSTISSVIKAGYHLHICFSTYKHLKYEVLKCPDR